MFPDEFHQGVPFVLNMDEFLTCFNFFVSDLDSIYVLDIEGIHYIGWRVWDPNLWVLVSRERSLDDPGVDTRGNPHSTHPAVGDQERARHMPVLSILPDLRLGVAVRGVMAILVTSIRIGSRARSGGARRMPVPSECSDRCGASEICGSVPGSPGQVWVRNHELVDRLVNRKRFDFSGLVGLCLSERRDCGFGEGVVFLRAFGEARSCFLIRIRNLFLLLLPFVTLKLRVKRFDVSRKQLSIFVTRERG